MGIRFFSNTNSDKLKLSSRTNTNYSVTVPPTNPNFSNVASSAHTFTIEELVFEIGTSRTDGLSKNEAHRRLERYGENLLKGRTGVSAWRVLVGQLGTTFVSYPRIILLSVLF